MLVLCWISIVILVVIPINQVLLILVWGLYKTLHELFLLEFVVMDLKRFLLS